VLVQISIRNFAIISELETRLGPGLNIVSGETGAGKSILINAVNLILGGRASSDLIRTGAEEARVEALFTLPAGSPAGGLLAEMELPFEGEVLISRTISREGRNSARINGSLATVQMLQRVSPFLISVSGQHEHQQLLRTDRHLGFLDSFGGLEEECRDLGESFHSHRALAERVERLDAGIRRLEEKRELDRFQMEEIASAGVEPGEDDRLQEERTRLRHAEEIQEAVRNAYVATYEKEGSILSEVVRLDKLLEKAARVDSRLEQVRGLLVSARAELEEAAIELRDMRGRIDMDPHRLEKVEDRLQVLTRLKRKYGPTLEDVLAAGERLSREMDNLEEMKLERSGLQKELAAAEEELLSKARQLSLKRREAAARFEEAVEGELSMLAMEGTRFRARFQEEPHTGPGEKTEALGRMGPDGLDSVEFLISPNVGEDLRPLSRIASGGELSRILLALKTILAGRAAVDTIVFDEVDAGIGGAVAETVGEKLGELARFHQILCITHLPQIACKGGSHYVVRKGVRNERTETRITELDPDSRVEEIARLLGGKSVSNKAVEHAREMLGK